MGILLVAAATYTPIASAHECTAEEGSLNEDSCSEECTEGEAHHHKVTHHHENGPFEDENHIHYECTSQYREPKDDEKKCTTPRIMGMCLISQDGGSPTLPDLPPTLGDGLAACLLDKVQAQVTARATPGLCV